MPASRSAHVTYRFGHFELQLAERRLLTDGAPVAVGPRGFDLLVVLLDHAGHLVTKSALFEQVWPKVIVDDSALQFQISALRKIIGAEAIATISGQGYRFMLDVVRSGAEAEDSAAPRHNLPAEVSSFVGRGADMTRLCESLDRARLVTITGAGGCGKTRLALRAATDVLARYPDGVWFVELASLADPALLPKTVTKALGIDDAPDAPPAQALAKHLAARRLLLVLDNAEHLLAACAELADALLRECRSLGLLVTSRERLGIAGELTYRVPSLATPDPRQPATPENLQGCESVQLFVDRARMLRPHFVLGAQNAEAVALICHRLDGIPLAIELAAGRMRAMPVEEIARRLDQRFSLLAGGAQAALPRHRTLRSLIDWSHDLLDAPEQALLARLSVFAGGCTLQAAEQVCTSAGGDERDVLDTLASLSDKNLLITDDQDGQTRYRLLETVRQYAAERLHATEQAPAWKSRHLAHYAALADAAAPHLTGAEQRNWFDRLGPEIANLRAALSWSTAAAETMTVGLGMANALGRFWLLRGQLGEGRQWYATLLAAVPEQGHEALHAAALNMAGAMAAQQGDNPAARAQFEHALDLFRALGDRRRIASCLNNLAISAQHDGDYARARVLYEENIAILRTLPSSEGLSRSLHNLGGLAQQLEEFERARALFEESLGLAREHRDRFGEAMTLGSLGLIAAQQGRYDEARTMLVDRLTVYEELNSPREIAYGLNSLAFVEQSIGAYPRAVTLWGAAEALRDSVAAPMPKNELQDHLGRIARVRASMADDEAFDVAWRKGGAMTVNEALRYATMREG